MNPQALPPLPWLTGFFMRWPPRLELRIDVQRPDESIERELDTLHRRLHTAADPLATCATLPGRLPGLVWRHREADGEHYVYVEDSARGCLAGYTVFNRLIEVDRRTAPHVRAPHSRYAPAYQRRGIATAVYEWGLEQGFCLVSGARQSAGAHALWLALGRRFQLGYVALHARRMHYLGAQPPAALRDDLSTRLLLIGPGWSLERLQALGLLQAARPAAPP
ncbi:MAG: hypothetical protein PHW25_06940 [Zoogloea sp.]|uniref:hypothetical protein n=1 Tax=Zoogloea sp. TaxID=49181 RepID=UPI002619C19F|nr:hypothetical protein [Zoogloea sp.]MDD3326803.1 hypothetical protein [Zoogloea sp.]